MLEKLLTIPASFSTSDNKRLSPLAYLFLLMLCFGFFAPGFATLPPTDRDESSFAQASKQMIETGNYTDIRLQKEPRYKKPIGIYWLQSTAVRIFNPHHLDEIWAYRIPSLIGAIIAVLMTAALGSLLFNPATGLIAGMMMAGCVLLNVEARIATTDAALLGSIMVAQYALARAYLGQINNWKMPLAFWTSLAIGILIKGPIILLPICSVLIWMKIADKNITWARSLKPLFGIPYALALIAPWFIAISMQSHGAFLQQSAGNDMLAKLWQGQNRGILPPGLHLMALPVVFFPYSLFVVFAAPDIWRNRRDTAVKFCIAWAVPTWLVFEISLTKLPHYTLPAYPAIAILTAKFLIDGLPSMSNTPRRLPLALIIAMWLMIGVGFAFVFSTLPGFSDHQWQAPQIIAGVLLIIAQGLALALLPRQKIGSFVIVTIGSLIFLSTTFGITLPSLHNIWMSREIVAAVDAIKPCPDSIIISLGYHEPSLAFLGGTDTMMTKDATEAAQDLAEGTCRVAVIDAKHKDEFIGHFVDTSKPHEVGAIEGLNSGHGAETALTLFVMPRP